MEPEEKVVRRARLQLGLVTHRQAIDRGMPASTIRRRVADHVWQSPRPDVYLVGGAPPTWQQSLLAVTLPFDDCWITHGTAARLWELPHPPEIDAVEVLRPYGRFRRLDGVVTRRSRLIVPDDVTHHRKIPVTALGRTIVECSGRLDLKQTGAMLDAGIRINQRTLEDTRECFARLAGGGRRRLRTIRIALQRRLPGYDPGESDLEIITLRVITALGLPMPVQQHRVVLDGKRRRIDLAYPELKIAIELQSWRWHGQRSGFDDDKARTSDLVAAGWRVIEITSAHSPAQIGRWITDTIAVASAAA